MPRRIAAIAIDWGAARLISFAFFHDDATLTLAIFALMQFAGSLFIGASVGHWLAGLRLIQKSRGGRIGILGSLVRALLLCLVIPVAVWDADGRGLHDKAAGTILVRR
jgi:uncharacterized RDD family membrane protein YckC